MRRQKKPPLDWNSARDYLRGIDAAIEGRERPNDNYWAAYGWDVQHEGPRLDAWLDGLGK